MEISGDIVEVPQVTTTVPEDGDPVIDGSSAVAEGDTVTVPQDPETDQTQAATEVTEPSQRKSSSKGPFVFRYSGAVSHSLHANFQRPGQSHSDVG